MSLYHNINHWDYNLDVGIGEHVAWIRYPFIEYKLDPICKVLNVYDDYSADLEVIQSSFLDVGTLLLQQSLKIFRRVKLTPINEDMTYNKSI